MDFSTHDNPADSQGQWYRMAIEHVLQASEKDVIAHTGWPSRAMRGTADPSHRYPLNLHQTHAPEICIGLSGRPILDIDQQRYSVAPPRLGILPRQVWHSEGFWRRNQSYRMLWLRITKKSVLGTVMHYRPDHGWDCLERHDAQSPVVRQLFDCIGNADHFPGSDQWELIRGQLLAILGQLAWQSMQSVDPVMGEPSAITRHHTVLEHLKDQLDNHFEHTHDLEQLAKKTRLTSRYIARMFKAWTGISVHRYHIQQRMNHAMLLCRETDLLVKEIAHQVGYDDSLYFSRAFQHHHRCSPSDVRKKLITPKTTL